LEKAIEIKRRAQRCIQNGDLEGALSEYEKLVAVDDADPYNFVLLADLLYKKSDHSGASQRYLSAAGAYEKAGLYKNAIAVCKKMMRLSLSPTLVVQRLAALHRLDGLSTESALYYMQHAELVLREDRAPQAAESLRMAFEVCPENIKALERLAEVCVLAGDEAGAAEALAQGVRQYQHSGQLVDADRCRTRLEQLRPGGSAEIESLGAGAVPDEASAEAPPGRNGESLVIERNVPQFEGTLASRAPVLAEPERVSPPSPEVERGAIADAPEPQARAVVAETRSSEAPGLQFEAPVAPADSAHREAAGTGPSEGIVRVEGLLAQAQEQFRSGNRDLASATLVEAARAYDELGQNDSAATIYRSLSKSAHAGAEVMMLWLRNCEKRRDLVEAAQVACELGDRALNESDLPGARGWFQRATTLDGSNALAHRRLQRLAAAAPDLSAQPAAHGAMTQAIPRFEEAPVTAAAAPVEIAPAAAAPAPAAQPAPAPASPGATPSFEPGRVEVAVGRGEAVTFDLGSLVSEFQRGIEAQISGDAQGHYDLGMTYREMGLLEQAVDAFRTAGRDPQFESRCAEMTGRCMLDQGRFDEAAQEFMAALETPGLPPTSVADLRYQLGLAHEAAGRVQEALAEFELVYSAQASYPDVSLKIRVLRKSLESR
jgi:tetratricopeptide (TPR) repeat protein